VAKVDLDRVLARYIDWFRANHPVPADLLEDDIRNWRLPADCLAPLPAARSTGD